MKKCPQCQKECADDVKFCPECGAELEEVVDAQTSDKKKSKLPLILALCGVLVLGVVVGIIAANAAGGKKEEAKQETTAKKSDDSDKKEAAKALKDKAKGDKDTKQEPQDDKKTGTGSNYSFQGDLCSFQFPDEWAGKVMVNEQANDKTRVITMSMIQKNEYGDYPTLYEIVLSDYPYSDDTSKAGVSAFYDPGYRETLGVSTTGVYAHLCAPTDVQFSPNQQADYMKLYNADLNVIRNSFKFNY